MLNLPCINCEIQCPEECAICRDNDTIKNKDDLIKSLYKRIAELTKQLGHKNA